MGTILIVVVILLLGGGRGYTGTACVSTAHDP
jgi:hypothetical protein